MAYKDKQKRKQTLKIWKETNKDKLTKSREDNLERTLFLSAKARAKRLGLEFDLEKSDILIPEFCRYLGVKLTRKLGNNRKRSWLNPSLDRINPNKGYTKDNIQIISVRANSMKSNAQIEDLIMFAKGVLKEHG